MIVQELHFYYGKETRGAKHDSLRYQFEYELPERFFDCPLEHNDKKTRDLFVLSTFRWYRKIEHMYTGAVFPFTKDDLLIFRWGYIMVDFRVFYKYDYRYMGLPEKYKQRADYYTKSDTALEECAFTLAPDEYGQLMYNGRFLTDESSYYIFTMCNILNNTGPHGKDCFIGRKPDKIYRQISRMY